MRSQSHGGSISTDMQTLEQTDQKQKIAYENIRTFMNSSICEDNISAYADQMLTKVEDKFIKQKPKLTQLKWLSPMFEEKKVLESEATLEIENSQEEELRLKEEEKKNKMKHREEKICGQVISATINKIIIIDTENKN